MASSKIIKKQTIHNPKKLIQQLAIIGGIGITAIFSNLVPSLSFNEKVISFESTASAQNNTPGIQGQTFSLETIWRYAAAVQEINPIREIHKQEINRLLKFDLPDRVCYQDDMPPAVKQSCDLFGSKMFNILRKHNIDDVYTPISIQVQSDDRLKRKIQKAGVCQQRSISLDSCF